MADSLNSRDYETGTAIRTFNIIETTVQPEGFAVRLQMDLDSGYELEDVVMKISHEDLAGYETNDIQEAVKYALGFFDSDVLEDKNFEQ
ncbi:hypothetical protein AB1K84_09415 [Mesobacillus foraminis]|uniref:hypothetical protein n=1 Tax=Mesobacillus foraminis TaxID=279826 RepID=UPI00399FABB9